MFNFSKKLLLPLSVSLLFFIGLGITVFYFQNSISLKQFEEKSLEVGVKKLEVKLTTSVSELSNNALFLSKLPPVQGIARALGNGGYDQQGESSAEQWCERLNIIFQEFLSSYPEYSKVRYIGLRDNGQELVTVKRFGGEYKVLKGDKLQEKSHRYYFREALRLKPGEYYLSKLDLSMEDGEVEEGMGAVMRAIVPVYDQKDFKMYGFVVLTKDMTETFERCEKALPPS